MHSLQTKAVRVFNAMAPAAKRSHIVERVRPALAPGDDVRHFHVKPTDHVAALAATLPVALKALAAQLLHLLALQSNWLICAKHAFPRFAK